MSSASPPKVILATFCVDRVFRVPKGLDLDNDSWYVRGDQLHYKRSTDDVWQISSNYEEFGDSYSKPADTRIDDAADWGMEDDTEDDDDDDDEDDDNNNVKDESDETAKDNS